MLGHEHDFREHTDVLGVQKQEVRKEYCCMTPDTPSQSRKVLDQDASGKLYKKYHVTTES